MDGKALAARVRSEVAEAVRELGGVGLATVLVGDDSASQIYIRNKHKAADEVGITAIDKRLPEGTTEEELIGLVEVWVALGCPAGLLGELEPRLRVA